MKQYLIIAFYILFSLNLLAQESIVSDKITLKTGEVYIGKIVLKTADLVMLTTNDGARFQFQLSEVGKIEKVTENIKTEKTDTINSNLNSENFAGIVEASIGYSNARNCFDWSPNTQISLTFGDKKLLGKSLFGGIGVGYENVFLTNNNTSIQFLPVFISIQSTISKKRTNPFFGMEVGYGFALSSGYNGGALVKLSAGITHKITDKSTFFFGIFAGVQSFSGNLTDTNDFGYYNYVGNTTMNNFGLKAGLQF